MASADHRANLATRKIGPIPGFEWYAWQCMRDPDGTVKLTGAVVIGVWASGKRKGRKRYATGTERIALITDAEWLAERARFEREEGKCAQCGGDGRDVAGWHHETGTKWRVCRACNGSGKPASVGAVDPVGDSTPV